MLFAISLSLNDISLSMNFIEDSITLQSQQAGHIRKSNGQYQIKEILEMNTH